MTARRTSLLVCAAGLAASPSLSAQQRVTVRLEVSRGAGAERCPDASTLAELVAARMGYLPFSPSAARSATVSFTSARAGLRAEVVVRDADGAPLGARAHATAARGCRDLAETVGLSLAVALEALPSEPAPPSVASPTTAPAPARVAPPSLPPPFVSSPSPRRRSTPARAWEAYAGASAVTLLGVQPGVSLGVALALGARWRRVSLGVEGRYDSPVDVPATFGGRANTTLLTVSASPCVHLGALEASARWAVCAPVTVGWIAGQGEGVEVPREDSAVLVWAGVRGEAAFVVHPRVAFTLRAEVGAALRGSDVSLDGAVVWSTSAVYGGLGFGARLRFL